jgi:membrane protein
VIALFGRWLVVLTRLQVVERSIALAASAFTAIFPLLIVWGSIVPRVDGKQFGDGIIDRFHLTGQSAAAVQSALAPVAETDSSLTGLGVALLIGSGLSFARLLQRLYEQAYGLPPMGLRATGRAIVWLVFFAASFSVRPAVGVVLGDPLDAIGWVATAAVVWAITPWLLLVGRMPFRELLPGAVLTAVALTALIGTSFLWFPENVASSAAQFGTLGIAFSMLSLLTAAGFAIVGATALAAALRGEGAAERP